MPEQPKSRLDREIDEILASKAKQPINFEQRRRQLTQPVEPTWKRSLRKGWWFVATSPLLLAYLLVGIALLLNDATHSVAVLLCTMAVVAIWLPGVRSMIRPQGTRKSEVKYWRGQAFISEVKSAGSRSPIDSLKRYFDARR